MPSTVQHTLFGLVILLAATFQFTSAVSSSNAPTGAPLGSEDQLRAFLDETHYEPGPVPNERVVLPPSTSAWRGRPCRVQMTHPQRGYQGDADSSPRQRSADASASFVVSGDGCVRAGRGGVGGEQRGEREDGREADPLVEGMELRVLVDGVEEGATSSSGDHIDLLLDL